MDPRFFGSIQLTNATLRVRDLEGLRRFYEKVLGCAVVAEETGRVALSASGGPPALLVLEHAPDATARSDGTAGLFHLAWLYPDRAALGRAVAHLIASGVPFGAGDHGVSEAIYLADHEGNGLELYVDRDRADWPASPRDDEVAMYTRPVDVAGVVAAGRDHTGPLLPPQTRIGHVHFNVSSLERSEAFYRGVLGFAVRQRGYPGALFLARDGYHHHIGLNTWRSDRPASAGSLGLASVALRFSNRVAFQEVAAAARAAGVVVRDIGVLVSVRDPDGIEIDLIDEPAW